MRFGASRAEAVRQIRRIGPAGDGVSDALGHWRREWDSNRSPPSASTKKGARRASSARRDLFHQNPS